MTRRPTRSTLTDTLCPYTTLVRSIVDSAGTLCNAAVALRDAGATAVSAYVTHGVLSGGAVARVSSSPLEELVMTDSIQATEAVRVAQNIRQISIAPLIGDAMQRLSDIGRAAFRERVCQFVLSLVVPVS